MSDLSSLSLAADKTVSESPAPDSNAPSSAVRVVDTHAHFYDPTRPQGVPFPSPDSPLYRPVYPADWLAVAAPHGAREVIVVEASPWLQDNQWILDLAADNPCIIGFVGNLLPHKKEFSPHPQRFAANPIFRGIRVNGDLQMMETEEFQNGLKLMADSNLALDINGPPTSLGRVAQMAAQMPALRIMLNHVGNAGDAAHLSPEWRSGMELLGQKKNVFCKISALIEQSDESSQCYGSAPREMAYYKLLLDHCWQCFGEDRLLYGSNWPVCEKGGTYADQFTIVWEYFSNKGPKACEKYFWENSQTAYQWAQR